MYNDCYLPIPGIWADRAQDCLDRLGPMTSPDEVITTYGSVRTVIGEILGFPATGGSGTKAVIRAAGKLFTHRLSPALATEALSWAASVSGVLDPASLEAFLEQAAETEVTYQPRRLTERDELAEYVGREDSEKKRLRALVDLWQRVHNPCLDEPPSPPSTGGNQPEQGDRAKRFAVKSRKADEYDRLSPAAWLLKQARSKIAFSPEEWLVSIATTPSAELLGISELSEKGRWLRISETDCPVDSRVAEIARTIRDDAGQMVFYEMLDATGREVLLESPQLFELCDDIIAASIAEFPELAFANPGCPQGLRDAVRCPYDRATLELAIAAGPRHFDKARMRRLLSEFDEATHRDFLESMSVPYLRAIRACGINTADELISGRLADLDLADRCTAEAILDTPRTWRCLGQVDNTIEVLIGHPQAASLTWLVPKITFRQGATRRILDRACPTVADHAISRIDPSQLTTADSDIAVRNGDYWIARCPGIAADEKPSVRIVFWPVAGAESRFDGPIDEGFVAIEEDGPFEYPAEIRSLEDSYLEAPAWTVSLPEDTAALRANADWMGNCTYGFVESIRSGSTFIVIVTAPDGERYNVEVGRYRNRFVVGQINSRFNNGRRPGWIAPAFAERLAWAAARPPAVGYREPAPLTRRPTDRRDRRRARARNAPIGHDSRAA